MNHRRDAQAPDLGGVVLSKLGLWHNFCETVQPWFVLISGRAADLLVHQGYRHRRARAGTASRKLSQNPFSWTKPAAGMRYGPGWCPEFRPEFRPGSHPGSRPRFRPRSLPGSRRTPPRDPMKPQLSAAIPNGPARRLLPWAAVWRSAGPVPLGFGACPAVQLLCPTDPPTATARSTGCRPARLPRLGPGFPPVSCARVCSRTCARFDPREAHHGPETALRPPRRPRPDNGGRRPSAPPVRARMDARPGGQVRPRQLGPDDNGAVPKSGNDPAVSGRPGGTAPGGCTPWAPGLARARHIGTG